MFVPAEWANSGRKENEAANESDQSRSRHTCIYIGSVSDLLRTRKVVDGLLNRQMCLDHEPDNSMRRADGYAAETEASGINGGTASGATKTDSGRTRKDGSNICEGNGKSNRAQSNRGRK